MVNNWENDPLVEVILNHDRLIYSIISHIKGRYELDDLFQVGIIGLIKAYRHFDPSYGTKFSTYAFPYIMGEIKKYVREDKSITISRDLLRLNARIEKAKDYLRQKLMKEPTLMELASFLEMDEQKLSSALHINNFISSLDVTLNIEGKELTLYDTIKDEQALEWLDKLSLEEQIASLPIKDQKLIRLRYTFDQTQSEVATSLGMTQVQVSRKEQKVLAKLRSGFQ